MSQCRRCATVVGPSASVEPLWRHLEPRWSPAREVRRDQPHLQIDGEPAVAPDPLVRPSEPADLEVLYPACVAMYTEEVGVSPEAGGGADTYRARVAQLVSKDWSFVRVESGRVVFKAEVAAASPHAAQVQGVYVDPARRGEGLAAAARPRWSGWLAPASHRWSRSTSTSTTSRPAVPTSGPGSPGRRPSPP